MDDESILKWVMTAITAVIATLVSVVGYLYRLTQTQNTRELEIHKAEIAELKEAGAKCEKDREDIRNQLVLVQQENIEIKIRLARVESNGT